MGILCARKGCERKKGYGLFCFEHRIVKPLESAGPQCIAVGCSVARPLGSLFCDEHKMAMNRDCKAPAFKAFDVPVEPFRAPLPDLDPERKENCEKLVVKWDSLLQNYEATCGSTNVKGHGDTPGAAIRNWIYWWWSPY